MPDALNCISEDPALCFKGEAIVKLCLKGKAMVKLCLKGKAIVKLHYEPGTED